MLINQVLDLTNDQDDVPLENSSADFDPDEEDEPIVKTWVETVPVAALRNLPDNRHHNFKALHWKGVDWTIMVKKRGTEVGSFLGIVVEDVPESFSVKVQIRCHLLDKAGVELPSDYDTNPLSHTYSKRETDIVAFGIHDQGRWKTATWQQVEANADSNQNVHMRFQVEYLYQPRSNPGLGYKSKEATGMVGLQNL